MASLARPLRRVSRNSSRPGDRRGRTQPQRSFRPAARIEPRRKPSEAARQMLRRSLRSERARVRIATSVEASVSLLPTVFAAALFGPLAGMIVAAASYLGDLPALMSSARRAAAAERGSPYLKWGIYTCVRA